MFRLSRCSLDRPPLAHMNNLHAKRVTNTYTEQTILCEMHILLYVALIWFSGVRAE